MMTRALPLLLLLAACAEPAPPPPAAAAPAATTCAAHEAGFAALIGLTEAEVRAALAGMPGIKAVRAGGPGAPMTMDFRDDRVTLAVQGGRVIRIACG
jgi:hypothetical protein